MERTCVIIKPDGVGKKVIGDIIKRFESEAGLQLVAMRMLRPSKGTIEEFYAVHKGKPFYEPLLNFMSCGPVVVTAWKGENAIARVRSIIGATNSREAAPGTVRQMYGTDNRRNVVHASDSPENGLKETSFFFKDPDILEYDHDCWTNK